MASPSVPSTRNLLFEVKKLHLKESLVIIRTGLSPFSPFGN